MNLSLISSLTDFSKEYVRKYILRQTEDEIAQMDAQIKADNDAGENDDSGDGFYDSNDNGENK